MRYPIKFIDSVSETAFTSMLRRAGVADDGIWILHEKLRGVVVRVDNVPAPAANIIKQQLLSLGGDAAVHRNVIMGRPEKSTVYIITDRRRIRSLSTKLSGQPFGLAELGEDIDQMIGMREKSPGRVSLPAGFLNLEHSPVIMGVLNLTPDSFSDGGLFDDPSRARDRAMEMVEEGAAVIDIGGESSRPGAHELDPGEEISRVMPVIELLSGKLPVPLSIDTRHAEVARAAASAGASIINDISGLTHDEAMPETALRTGAALVIMHMKGEPATMQNDPRYDDPASEILDWLGERSSRLISAGVARDKIIIDPGIGFGKRLRDNLEIIDRIGDFSTLGFPVLVGHSRKSFIGAITGRDPGERLWGGFAALAKCVSAGVQILRVHDVKETADFLKVWRAIERRDTGS